MATFVTPALQRTLSVVYRFHDAFFVPLDDRTPPIRSPLEVTISALQWQALHVEHDATYRFSTLTLTKPPPSGINLEVQVTALNGDYMNLEPLLVTLPRPLSTPVQPADFLIHRRLWPTIAVRPPSTETAVRGQIRSGTAQPVANLTVEMWTGPATPPAGTPFTRTDARGEFLFRLPGLKGAPGSVVPFRIRLNGGGIPVVPATPPIVLGRTQALQFDRP